MTFYKRTPSQVTTLTNLVKEKFLENGWEPPVKGDKTGYSITVLKKPTTNSDKKK